jgi:outer membrane protein assembly factor BamB
VYVGVTDGNTSFVDALDPATGDVVWGAGPPGTIPAVANHLVYVGTSVGCYIFAQYALSGDTAWRFSTACEIEPVTAITAVEGLALFGIDVTVFARDATTGDFVWSTTVRSLLHGAPAVANGIVYAATTDSILALDEATGAIMWTTPLAGGTLASPAVANGVVYMTSHDGRLRAWDALTGEPLWQSQPAAAPLGGSPAVSDGVVYTSADDGTVYAFGLP